MRSNLQTTLELPIHPSLISRATNIGIRPLSAHIPSFFTTITDQTFWELEHGVSTDVPNFQELREQLDANTAAKVLFAKLQRAKNPKVQSRLMGRIRAILSANGEKQ